MVVPADIRRCLDFRYLLQGNRYTDEGSTELVRHHFLRRRRRLLSRNSRLSVLRQTGGSAAAPDADRLRRLRGLEASPRRRAERQGHQAEIAGVEARDDDVHHRGSGEFQADGAAGDRREIRRRERATLHGAPAQTGASQAHEPGYRPADARHVGFFPERLRCFIPDGPDCCGW